MSYYFPTQFAECTEYPDWRKAPSWAEWWAFDVDGTAWWYPDKPTFDGMGGYWVGDKRESASSSIIRHCGPWDLSLVPRPTKGLLVDVDDTLVERYSSKMLDGVRGACRAWKDQKVQPVLVTSQGGAMYRKWLESLAEPKPDWASHRLNDIRMFPTFMDIQTRIGEIVNDLSMLMGIAVPAYCALGYRFRRSGEWCNLVVPEMLDKTGEPFEEFKPGYRKPEIMAGAQAQSDFYWLTFQSFVGDPARDNIEFSRKMKVDFWEAEGYFAQFKDVLLVYYNPNYICGKHTLTPAELSGLDREATLSAFEGMIMLAMSNRNHLRSIEFHRDDKMDSYFLLGADDPATIYTTMYQQVRDLLTSWSWLRYNTPAAHANALANCKNPLIWGSLVPTIAQAYHLPYLSAIQLVEAYRGP